MALTFLPSAAHAHAIFTDRASFGVSAAGIAFGDDPVTDTFETKRINAPVIVFDSGIVSSGLPDGERNRNSVRGNRNDYFGRLSDPASGGGSFNTITWTFPRDTFAVGADWSGINNIVLIANYRDNTSDTFRLGDAIGSGSGFFGFISQEAFQSVTLTLDPEAGGNASFSADNLTFTQIPSPGVIGLLGLGLFGVHFAGRRKAL